jgi:hypothetical protein
MGPTVLFDKSFLQSLTVDESVWFNHFTNPLICPLFYMETLADLEKNRIGNDRTGEDEVRIIAEKTPELSGAPCAFHINLCVNELVGYPIPMKGSIPLWTHRPCRPQRCKSHCYAWCQAIAGWQGCQK